MLYMLDASGDYDVFAAELGVHPTDVGQLITPLTRRSNRGRSVFAIDNGAFSCFNAAGFMSLLEREHPNKSTCRFVVAPDVPCDARRTLELFERWAPRLAGWSLALAIQDGQEHLPIPWDWIDAVFIAGSDAWKTSHHSHAVVRAAKALGKWVHMGRVNTPKRLATCLEWGVDSIDGTGISRFSAMRVNMRRVAGPVQHSLDLE